MEEELSFVKESCNYLDKCMCEIKIVLEFSLVYFISFYNFLFLMIKNFGIQYFDELFF